jgi:Polysaccharide pyruvyl transferase/Methyltransferase domain
MDFQNVSQVSTVTETDRYPELFRLAASQFVQSSKPPRVLSYGCSSGEECFSLRKYFPNSQITGVDINPFMVRIASRANQDPMIDFHCLSGTKFSPNDLYDVIFAMSVLCRWPVTQELEDISNTYPFEAFERQIAMLDSWLSPGGLLCVFNSNYAFADAVISGKYLPIPSNLTEQISEKHFVRCFPPNGRLNGDYLPSHFLFQKALDSAVVDKMIPARVTSMTLETETESNQSSTEFSRYLYSIPSTLTKNERLNLCKGISDWALHAPAAELRIELPSIGSLFHRIPSAAGFGELKQIWLSLLENPEHIGCPSVFLKSQLFQHAFRLGDGVRMSQAICNWWRNIMTPQLPEPAWIEISDSLRLLGPLLSSWSWPLFESAKRNASPAIAKRFLPPMAQFIGSNSKQIDIAMNWLTDHGELSTALDIAKFRLANEKSAANMAGYLALLLQPSIGQPLKRLLGDIGTGQVSDRQIQLAPAILRQAMQSHSMSMQTTSEVFQLLDELKLLAPNTLVSLWRQYLSSKLNERRLTEQLTFLNSLPEKVSFDPGWRGFLKAWVKRTVLEFVSETAKTCSDGNLQSGWQILLKDHAPSSDIMFVIGRALCSQHDYEQARLCANSCFAHFHEPRFAILESQAWHDSGASDQAYASLERAMGEFPNDEFLKTHAVRLSAELNEFERVIRLSQPELVLSFRPWRDPSPAPMIHSKTGNEVNQLRELLGISEIIQQLDLPQLFAHFTFPEEIVHRDIQSPLASDSAKQCNKWLAIGYNTLNIGDDMQSLAAIQHLSAIDGFVDRDRLSQVKDAGAVSAIMNGWYIHKEPGARGIDWPPPENLRGFWGSMHITPVAAGSILTSSGVDYLRSVGPIGCRDRFTEQLLNAANVPCYFSGCMTMTFPRYEGERLPYFCLTDLDVDVTNACESAVVSQHDWKPYRIRHQLPYSFPFDSFAERLQVTRELLAVYASASLVVTSRLHAALPSLAVGTPVLMIHDDWADLRFGDLLSLVPRISPQEFLTNPSEGIKLARSVTERMAETESLISAVKRFATQATTF